MAQRAQQSTRAASQGQGQAAPGGKVGGPRDIGDRARLALIIVATLALVVTFGHWALTVAGLFASVAGRYDFSSYYAAALALRENIHANIYSAVTMAQAGAKGQTLVNPPLPYTYPPLLAILLSPLTVLSFRILSRGWMLGNITLWIGTLFVFAAQARYLLGDTLKRQPQVAAQVATTPAGVASGVASGVAVGTPARRSNQSPLVADPTPLVALALAAVVSLSFSPAYQTIMTGQVNFVVLAPLAIIPALSSHRHERWVGVMVALAALLKITPIILVGYLLLRRRWEAAISAIVAMAVLSLFCIVIVGPGVFFALIPAALKVGSTDALLHHNQALLAPIGVALGDTSAFKVGEYAVLALLAVVFGYVLWRTPYPGPASAVTNADADRYTRAELRAHNETETLAYSLALCAMLLLSPTAWVHHYVWLAPAAIPTLALAWRAALTATTQQARRRAWGLVALTAVATLALAWSLPYSWDTIPSPAQKALWGVTVWPYILESRPLGALALAVVIVILLRGYVARWAAQRARPQRGYGGAPASGSRSNNGSASSSASPAEGAGQRTAGAPASWAPVPASSFPRIFHEGSQT